MKPIKRKYKPTIVCDKCHKSIGKTKPSYKKVGEIEYRYWRCRHCSTVYVISATDAELRKKIQEYQEFVDEYKDKEMPQEEMQKAQLILQTNVERSREIKEQYPLTLKPSDVEGGQATTTTKTTVIKEKKAFKGTEIHAIVIQKNPYSDGKDKVLDCGKFEIDSVSYQGPPQKLTIKATSIPYSTKLRQEKKSKTWENTNLKNIAEKIGKGNSMKVMYLSSHNPSYKRKEQVNTADIVFLKKLCKNAGISLKVTSKTIVLFDEADYEKKSSVKKIKAGKGNILSYSFSTKTADTSYSKCHVSYTDPNTKKTIEATYTAPGADPDGQTYEFKHKVTSQAEALELAKCQLRQRNKGETTAEFTLVGDVDYVAGITVTVYGYGEFDGKYIVEQAQHSITGGYKVQIKLRSVLEGY